MDVHTFWALGFQKYLPGIKVTSSLTDVGYELGEPFESEFGGDEWNNKCNFTCGGCKYKYIPGVTC